MASNPYLTKLPQYAFNELTFKHRNGAYPLDDTSVWDTKSQFVEYLEESGTYAYAGQLVTIANGSIESSNGSKDYSLAIVRSDGSYQMFGEHSFESKTLAEAWVTANPEVATAGTVLSAKADSGDNYLLYVINADKSLSRVSFDSSTDIPEITWDAILNKPTSTVTDIDAAVTLSKKFGEGDNQKPTYNANALAYVSDIPTTYEASKITGTISIDNLPATALERLAIVSDDAERLALTTATVQTGDTVKVNATGKMYFVKDDTKLGTGEVADAFEEYVVGTAGAVAWANVTGKPTTVAESGLTDALSDSDTSATGVAGKVAIYNEHGKLSATAADADKLGGQDPTYYATASDLDAAEAEMEEIQTAIDNLESGASITEIAASKITGTVARTNLPADVGGKIVSVANNAGMLGLTAENINLGDLVKLQDTGAVYMYNNAGGIGTGDGFVLVVDVADVVSSADIAWENITDKPTTLDGYGITDAVKSNTVSTEATANMIVQRDADGKIAGTVANAETLGGQQPSYYATATALANVASGEGITALAADKLTGTVPFANLPATVVERLSIVANETALLELTSASVQNGDSVKVQDTGKMYFVKDDTQLGNMAAFEEYTVGSAATVPFTGITGLDASVTAANLKTAVEQMHTHANATVLDDFSDSDGNLMYGENQVAYVADISSLATIPVLDTAPESPFEGQLYFQTITLE